MAVIARGVYVRSEEAGLVSRRQILIAMPCTVLQLMPECLSPLLSPDCRVSERAGNLCGLLLRRLDALQLQLPIESVVWHLTLATCQRDLQYPPTIPTTPLSRCRETVPRQRAVVSFGTPHSSHTWRR